MLIVKCHERSSMLHLISFVDKKSKLPYIEHLCEKIENHHIRISLPPVVKYENTCPFYYFSNTSIKRWHYVLLRLEKLSAL